MSGWDGYDNWKTRTPAEDDRVYCRCDQCDSEIYVGETYIRVLGMNLCHECFDDHRHSVDCEEEEWVCNACGEHLSGDWYYSFDGEIWCEDCIEQDKEEVRADDSI